jgi:hypothetical protein
MNKWPKTIARAVVFVISMVVAVSAFGLLSAWVMSELDPAQQEAIGAINTPWVLAQADRTFVPKSAGTLNGRTENERRIATSTDASPHVDSVVCAELTAIRERSCTGGKR